MDKIIDTLKAKDASLHKRIRALFSLKPIGNSVIQHLMHVLLDDNNVLLCHEVAYVLGQMRDPIAVPVLTQILLDTESDPIIRHECAESLGAIGMPESLSVLKSLIHHPNPLISETCVLSIARISESLTAPPDFLKSPYTSIDPAPAEVRPFTLEQLECTFLDTKVDMYIRYKSMFALRNLNSTEAVMSLAKGFSDPSPLFRHEVAFVFGQMQHKDSVPCLIKVLENLEEVGVVRHEAAEALGSIATPECFQTLQKFIHDKVDVVRDSCLVGLDMVSYENGQELEYAYVVNR